MIIEALPESIAALLPELSLLLVGYAVEKHYVSRVTCFTNVMALAVHFLTVGGVGLWSGIYVDFGWLLGLLGFMAYWRRESLSTTYYNLVHILYSSLIVGSILVYPHVVDFLSRIPEGEPMLAKLLFGFIFIVNLALLEERNELHYTASNPVAVNQFIRNSRIRIPQERGWSDFIRISQWFDEK